jgi:antitoxin PrlF
MKSVVSEKGQVTIPKPIRERLGLRTGTVIVFEASEGRLVGKKAIADDPFTKWRGRGRLPVAGSVDAYLRRIRDANRG